MDFTALLLSVKLASATTLILAIVGIPLAYALARAKGPLKLIAEALVALPLVLPPTVLGFYILLATGPNHAIGQLYERLTGGILPFSFPGILIASVLYNLPFAVRPFQTSFEAIDKKYLEASWSLGVSRWATFFRVSCRLAWPGLLAGMILAFAHTIGEFGVVLMVGGNIPGVTRTISMQIYDDVQALDYASAGRTSLLLLCFAFAVLLVAQSLLRRAPDR